MTDDLVWIHRDPESVVKLVLNRPAKANALTGAMLDSLCAAVTEAGRSGARALVLTGNGKVFSAGADLGEAAAGLAVSSAWERLSGAVADLPCLTVAALNGTMAGDDWAKLGTSAALWIGLPLAVGTWRVLTREVK